MITVIKYNDFQIAHNKHHNYKKLNGYIPLKSSYDFTGFKVGENCFNLFCSVIYGFHTDKLRVEIWNDFKLGLSTPNKCSKDYYFQHFKSLIEAERKHGEVILLVSEESIKLGITPLVLKAIEWLKTQI